MGTCSYEISLPVSQLNLLSHQQVSFYDDIYLMLVEHGNIRCMMLSCHYLGHAELLMLCDHLMWRWPLTCLVAYLTRGPWVYLSGRYHRCPALNSAGPRCYVMAENSSMTHVRVVENEALIHSPASLATLSRSSSLHLAFWLRSIYYSICLFTEGQWALATWRREWWILRQGSNLTTEFWFHKIERWLFGADGNEGLNSHVQVSGTII